MAKRNESALDRLIKKLTKATPIEQESSVKLDHDFDGIEELNNPLPPWWSLGFLITVIIGVIYTGYYFMNYYDIDKIGKWQEMELANEMKKAQAKVEAYKKEHNIVDANTVTALTDEAALAEGKEIYIKNCAACHLNDGGGSVGPNLTDDTWIYGCDIKSVFNIVSKGTSKGMPPWKHLGADKIQKVSSYILTLQGTKPANPKAAEGEPCNKE
jgi:cytochrome c oxidase cbb3-type subunit 3